MTTHNLVYLIFDHVNNSAVGSGDGFHLVSIYCKWEVACEVPVETNGGLICPTSGDIAHRVAATAEHQKRQFEPPHELNALPVALCETKYCGLRDRRNDSPCMIDYLYAEVEDTETVVGEGICSALQDNR